jgi:hypothetical protein
MRAVLVLVASAALARAQSITWTGAGAGANAGLWTFAGNWNQNRLPGPADDVLIPAGAAVVRLNSGTQSVNSITCNAPFSFDTGTLSVAVASSFSGGVTFSGATLAGSGPVTLNCNASILKGALSGTGQLVIPFGKTLTIAPLQTPTFAKPIVNQGAIQWNGGEVAFAGATITVQSGAALLLSGASKAWVASGSNAIINNVGGTILKSDSGTFQTSGGVALNNSGTVLVNAGTLHLASTGSLGGTLTIGTGASVLVTADQTFVAGSRIDGEGVFNVSGGICTITGDVSWSNMRLTNGTIDGVGKISLLGATNQWLSGSIKGAGTLSVSSGATLSVLFGSHTLARTLENRGTLSWSAGTIGVTGGTINNLAGATFLVNAADSCVGGAGGGVLNNYGTITKSGQSTSAFATSAAPMVVNNYGSVQVTQGMLTFGSGGNHTGNFSVSSGATLTMGSVHTTGSTTMITGTGTLTIPSSPASSLTVSSVIDFPGTLNILSGTLIANGNMFVGNPNLIGGTVAGTGQLALTGPSSSWNGGTMLGTGKTVIAAGATMVINATNGLTLQRGLDISGTLNWTAGNFSFGPVQLQVKTGGVINASPGGSMYAVGTNAAVFSNSGTFNKTGNTTTTFSRSDITSSLAFNNFGLVNVQQGTIDLVTGGSSTGTFQVGAGAVLSIGGSYTFGTGSTVTGAGRTDLPSTGTITLQGQCTWSNAKLTGATITGAGDLTLVGVSTWSAGTMSGLGKTTVAAGATLNLSGGAHTLARRLENFGTLNWTGGAISISASTLSNRPGGVFYMNCNESILGAGEPALVENLGTITKTGPTSVLFVNSSSNIMLDSSGTINVDQGGLSLPSQIVQLQAKSLIGGTWNVGNSGALTIPNAQIRTLSANVSLSGPNSLFPAINYLSVINGSFSLVNGRSFRATPNGGELINLGVLTLAADSSLSVVGNFSQSTIGKLSVGWGTVNGAASLGSIKIIGFGIISLAGVLDVTIPSELPPPCGSEANVVAAPYLVGEFDLTTLPEAVSGRMVDVAYAPSSVRLTADSTADFNADGFLDFTDFDAFVAAFEANTVGADFNGDGFLDFTDFDGFVAVFETGC